MTTALNSCSLPRMALPALPAFPLAHAWRIAAIVMGFILWWPIGLALLLLWKGMMMFGLCSRRRDRSPADLASRFFTTPSSGNTAFDDHRSAVLQRLEQERQALDRQQQEFNDFLHNLKRARDREEFDRFIAGRQAG